MNVIAIARKSVKLFKGHYTSVVIVRRPFRKADYRLPSVPVVGHHDVGLGFRTACAGPAASVKAQSLMTGGLLALAVFVIVRGMNGYGNLLLLRDDQSLVQWLHVSKYPPSLSFYALELGLMALLLSFLFRWRQRQRANASGLLLVLDQTAFFFYLLHGHLLLLAARSLGVSHQRGLPETFIAAGAAIGLLYPSCRWYRGYKATHPKGWVRYA